MLFTSLKKRKAILVIFLCELIHDKTQFKEGKAYFSSWFKDAGHHCGEGKQVQPCSRLRSWGTEDVNL